MKTPWTAILFAPSRGGAWMLPPLSTLASRIHLTKCSCKPLPMQDGFLYSFNVGDFMALHKAFMSASREHAGIVLSQQQRYSVGEQMRRLIRLTQVRSSESMRNRI